MWEKIVLNLLSNAFKFTFDGEIAVSAQGTAGRRRAELTVRDTGIGIPADELPRLFERFHRVEGAARAHRSKAAASASRWCRNWCGCMAARSVAERALDEGSAFTVSLPFGTAHLPADQIGRAPVASPPTSRAQAYVDEALGWLSDDLPDARTARRPWRRRMSATSDRPSWRGDRLILLADDNADMRDYLRRLLLAARLSRGGGDRRRGGAGGGEGDCGRDLVLSDVMMPRLDGFGLLTALRARRRLARHAGAAAVGAGRRGGQDRRTGRRVPTIISPSRSARANCWRACAPISTWRSCGGRRCASKTNCGAQAQIAQERAESILSSINDGFLALDRDWRFTSSTPPPSGCWSGRRRNCSASEFWAIIRIPLAPNWTANSITRWRRGKAPISKTFIRRHDAGSTSSVYPSRDGGLSIYFQDITERKRAEEALRRLNETLEAQVAARTAELRAKEARLRTILKPASLSRD